jgi:hypothetical protein
MHRDPDAFEERALDLEEVIEHAERYLVSRDEDDLAIHEPENPGPGENLVSRHQVVRLILHRLDEGATVSIGSAP